MPKRKILRLMHNMDYTGTQAEVTLRAAGDPVTIVRMIMQFIVLHYTSSMAEEIVNMEIWRSETAAGAALPTMDNTGDVPYADNQDLMWKGAMASFQELTTSGVIGIQSILNVDSKGARTLSRSE